MTNDSAIVCWLAEHPIKIHKWKVRDGAQVQRNHIVLLYQEQGDDADPKIKQYKTKQSGVVVKRLFKDGDIVNKGYVYENRAGDYNLKNTIYLIPPDFLCF